MKQNYDEYLEIYEAATKARIIRTAGATLEAKRLLEARHITRDAELWRREVRARRFWKRIALALAALVLMEFGGVITLVLIKGGV